MTTATEQTAQLPQTAPAKGIQVTDKALVKVRSAMAKEGISPEQGGLRLGVQGGGCSGLSYNVRFDTQPRERDRTFLFGAGLELLRSAAAVAAEAQRRAEQQHSAAASAADKQAAPPVSGNNGTVGGAKASQ